MKKYSVVVDCIYSSTHLEMEDVICDTSGRFESLSCTLPLVIYPWQQPDYTPAAPCLILIYSSYALFIQVAIT